MTEIPEPTKEDFEFLQKLQLRFAATDFSLQRHAHSPDKSKVVLVDLQSAIRLLHHYRTRCEELERERDAKRFLLFAGPVYYPGGGWNDFKGAFATEEEANDAAKNLHIHDRWWHVVDSVTNTQIM